MASSVLFCFAGVGKGARQREMSNWSVELCKIVNLTWHRVNNLLRSFSLSLLLYIYWHSMCGATFEYRVVYNLRICFFMTKKTTRIKHSQHTRPADTRVQRTIAEFALKKISRANVGNIHIEWFLLLLCFCSICETKHHELKLCVLTDWLCTHFTSLPTAPSLIPPHHLY